MRPRHHGLALFVRYVVISLVPVLLVGIGVELYTRHQGRVQLERQATRQVEGIVTSSTSSLAGGIERSGAIDPISVQALRATVERARDLGLLHSLRLWTPTGGLLWADERARAAPATVSEGAFFDAAAGSVGAAEGWPEGLEARAGVSVPDGLGGAADPRVPVLTVFVPIRSGADGPAALVAEVVVPLDQTGLFGSQQQLRVVLAASVAILWLVLALLTRSTTAKLQHNAQALRELALYDPLTGLPNRRQFADEVTRSIEALGPHGQPGAVVLLDLLGFTRINNALGRAYGDELLRYVAERLGAMIQPGQFVGRIGGDVFGLLLPGVDGPTALRQLDVVRHVLAAEIEVAGIPVGFEAVVGIASFPLDGAEADVLLQRADLALGAAKRAEIEARVFSAELDRADPTRLGLAVELRRAIANGELFLVYQPKVHLVDLGVRSVEALVRWNHPERGPVPPSEFVPVAESTGLIGPLTAWVLDTAVAQAASWAYNGMPMRVAINVSARNLRDEHLPEYVLRSLLKHNLPPDYIELEITETAIITEPERAARALRRLRDAGVAVALDDFGQGATSLGHLRNLRLSTLKIDKCFIDNLCTDDVDAAIVYNLISLGHQLGMEVVAEGVESEAQAAALAAWGCDVAQGFHFSRPLTVAQLQTRFGRSPERVAAGQATLVPNAAPMA